MGFLSVWLLKEHLCVHGLALRSESVSLANLVRCYGRPFFEFLQKLANCPWAAVWLESSDANVLGAVSSDPTTVVFGGGVKGDWER